MTSNQNDLPPLPGVSGGDEVSSDNLVLASNERARPTIIYHAFVGCGTNGLYHKFLEGLAERTGYNLQYVSFGQMRESDLIDGVQPYNNNLNFNDFENLGFETLGGAFAVIDENGRRIYSQPNASSVIYDAVNDRFSAGETDIHKAQNDGLEAAINQELQNVNAAANRGASRAL